MSCACSVTVKCVSVKYLPVYSKVCVREVFTGMYLLTLKKRGVKE